MGLLGHLWPNRICRRIAEWKRRRLHRRIELSLASCGKFFVLSDPSAIVLWSPENIGVGDNVAINAYVYINAMGGVKIGDDTRIGPFVTLSSGDHRYDDLSVPICKQGWIKERIEIGCDVWIGAHAIILRGAKIPDHCVIGAGTRVDRRLTLKPYDIVIGSPAEVVGNRLVSRVQQRGKNSHETKNY